MNTRMAPTNRSGKGAAAQPANHEERAKERARWQREVAPLTWETIMARYFFPSLREPIFTEKEKGGAYLDFKTGEMKIGCEVVEEVRDKGGLNVGIALEGIEGHEVGHYMQFPRNLSTLLTIGFLTDTQFNTQDSGTRMFITQTFMDLGNDMLSVLEERKRGPILKIRAALQISELVDAKSPFDITVRGIMLAYLYKRAGQEDKAKEALADGPAKYVADAQGYFDRMLHMDFTNCGEAFGKYEGEKNALLQLRLGINYFGNIVIDIMSELKDKMLQGMIKKIREGVEELKAQGKKADQKQIDRMKKLVEEIKGELGKTGNEKAKEELNKLKKELDGMEGEKKGEDEKSEEGEDKEGEQPGKEGGQASQEGEESGDGEGEGQSGCKGGKSGKKGSGKGAGKGQPGSEGQGQGQSGSSSGPGNTEGTGVPRSYEEAGDQLQKIKDMLDGKESEGEWEGDGGGKGKGKGRGGFPGPGESEGGDMDPSEQLDGSEKGDIDDALRRIAGQMSRSEFEKLTEWVRDKLKDQGKAPPKKGTRGSRSIGVGLGGGELLVDQNVVEYYRTLSQNFDIPLTKKIMPTRAKIKVADSTKKWRPGDDPSETLRYTSGGKFLPGITRAIARTERKVRKRDYDVPYLLVVIDSSGSMPNPATEMNHAVLGGFCLARAYTLQGSQVGVVNFSGKSFYYPYTRELDNSLAAIAAFQAGGTVVDVELVRQMLGTEAARIAREHPEQLMHDPAFERERNRFMKKDVNVSLAEEVFKEGAIDVVMFTDGGIANLQEVLYFMNEQASLHRATIVLTHGWVGIDNRQDFVGTEKVNIVRVDDPRDIPKVVIGEARKNLDHYAESGGGE